MDFSLTEEQLILKDSLRKFLDREITPIASERDAQGPLTRKEVVEYIKKLIPFGFYLGGMSEEHGGSNIDYKTTGMIYEELARSWAGLAGAVNLTDLGLFQTMLLEIPNIREKYLPRIQSAELITCGAITEPNVGSDTTALETTALLDGDHYVVNGSKMWISNGPICDVCMVLVQTDKSLGSLGIRMIMVDREESPFESRELLKLGLHAFPTGELTFSDCRVPKENMIPEGSYLGMMKGFDAVRPLWGFHATGIAQAALDASIEYAQNRMQFGKPIGKFQMVQDMIYEMYSLIETSRLLCYRVADMLDKGEKCRKEASLAKGYATEAAIRATSLAIEVHGAYGLSQEFPLERYFRDARTWTIPDGTTEIQKLIVAGELLKLRAVR
ncbi:MAG: acyl-CoA dehydrogenase family protein [Spirochaetota bacterium]|nr:acyl-CoA dehydrogenase family protein [Spirochaetota bacterium]